MIPAGLRWFLLLAVVVPCAVVTVRYFVGTRCDSACGQLGHNGYLETGWACRCAPN